MGELSLVEYASARAAAASVAMLILVYQTIVERNIYVYVHMELN